MIKNSIGKNWVFFSTSKSLIEKKYSLLAIVELFICCYAAIIFNQTIIQAFMNGGKSILNNFSFDYDLKLIDYDFISILSFSWNYIKYIVSLPVLWLNSVFTKYGGLSYLALLIPLTPTVLMKSAPAIKLGERKLKIFWNQVSWYDLSKKELWILTIIVSIICAIILQQYLSFENKNLDIQYFDLILKSIVSSFVVFVVSILVFVSYRLNLSFNAENFKDAFLKMFPKILFIEVNVCIVIYYHTNSILLILGNFILTLCFFALFLRNRKDDFKCNSNNDDNSNFKSVLSGNFPPANLFSATFMLPWLAALFFRLLYIRIISSLCCYKSGLISIPENWKALNFSTDFASASALMPNAKNVSNKLTTGGVLSLCIQKFNPKNYSDRYSKYKKFIIYICERLILIQSLVIFFIGANIYRLAIKSTFWVWWLISINFTKKRNIQRFRDNQTKLTIGWATNPILITIFIYCVVFFAYISDENFQKIIDKLVDSSASIGHVLKQSFDLNFNIIVKFWVLLIFPTVCFFLYLKAIQVNSLFKKDLEDRVINKLSSDDTKLYHLTTNSLELLRRFFWFTFWQSIWWIILALLILPNVLRVDAFIKSNFFFWL